MVTPKYIQSSSCSKSYVLLRGCAQRPAVHRQCGALLRGCSQRPAVHRQRDGSIMPCIRNTKILPGERIPQHVVRRPRVVEQVPGDALRVICRTSLCHAGVPRRVQQCSVIKQRYQSFVLYNVSTMPYQLPLPRQDAAGGPGARPPEGRWLQSTVRATTQRTIRTY